MSGLPGPVGARVLGVGAGAPRRWSPATCSKLLGMNLPTIENRTKALSKLSQRQIDDMTTSGELRCLHGGVTNRKQMRSRWCLLQTWCEHALNALAAFESKRALLGNGHLQSPLTVELLEKTTDLQKSDEVPWKSDAWQVALVQIFSERFFTYQQPKPFASAYKA